MVECLTQDRGVAGWMCPCIVLKKHQDKNLQDIFLISGLEQYFNFVLAYDDLTHSKKHDIDQLYSDIKARHVAEKHSILPNIQHPFFRPQLRLYQQEAISWMVEKEKQFVRLEDENKQTKSGKARIFFIS